MFVCLGGELKTRSKEDHQWQMRILTSDTRISIYSFYNILYVCTLFNHTYCWGGVQSYACQYLQCSAMASAGEKGYVLILNDCHFWNKTSFIICVTSHSVTT